MILTTFRSVLFKHRSDWFGLQVATDPLGVRNSKRGTIVMQRTLNAFENTFDRLAGGYFLVIALGVAAALIGVAI